MSGFIEQENKEHTEQTAPLAEKKKLPVTALLLIFLSIAQIAFAAFVLEKFSALESSPTTSPEASQDLLTPVQETLGLIEHELSSLDAALIKLEKRTEKIEKNARPKELEKELEVLEDNLTDLRQTLSEENVAQLLQARDEMQKLHRQIARDGKWQWQIIKLFTLAEALDKAIGAGQPFESLLGLLRESSTPDIDSHEWAEAIAPYAESGAPTEDDIATLTKSAIEDFYNTASNADENFFAALWHNVKSLITIRKVGASHAGEDDESIIARIESDIASGNYVSAQREMMTLSRDAEPSFQDLYDAVDIFLTLEETIADMRATIESHLQQQEPAE